MHFEIFIYIRLFFLWSFADGDEDKEDIRRGIIGADDAGGRQKLLRAIRSGEYNKIIDDLLLEMQQ